MFIVIIISSDSDFYNGVPKAETQGNVFFLFSSSFASTGNTEEEDDLILEGEMGQVETGDWILLGNVGLADCRDLDMILLDKDYRYNSGTKPGGYSEPTPL